MILVFGKTGQVATELQRLGGCMALGRDDVDLSDPAACAAAINKFAPNAVINAAAYTTVDRAEDEEYLATAINGEAPTVMAIACAALGIPLVHISTDYVFKGTGNTPYRPYDTTEPQNTYGRSKCIGEDGISNSGAVYAILRTSWVVSAHGNNFVKTMLRLSKTRDNFTVVDDQIGGPTCARDIAKACISISRQLMREPSKSGIYHFTGQPDVSWCQFANAVLEQIGSSKVASPIPSSEYPMSAKRPQNSRLNCETTKQVFGIPRPFWRDGLEEIINELEKTYDKA